MSAEHRKYPVGFRISERARRRILTLINNAEMGNRDVHFIAEIGWATRYEGIDEQPGPVVGFRTRSQVTDDYIDIVDGLELVVNLHESLRANFEHRMLDYLQDRFVLV